ncbi:MAG: NAD-dependent epimerase/dehydratase family protein [Candidatus Marinimicrobia bacterium]|nr:NAD-dependent epimerase/dehydratase family protein [Candidatus Neomarinimicrobiota bacterium]
MKILITGGAGFIGSHVADAYIKEGHDVVIIDNLVTGQIEFVNQKAKFYKFDIRSREAYDLIMDEKFDVINHHAAQIDVRKSTEDPKYDAEVNILGSINILEASNKSGVKRFIFISTGGAIYGEQDYFPADEEHPTRPISPYGIGKLTVEKYLYYYNQVFKLDYVVLRYANVYGPRQNPHGEAGVVAIFCDKMLRGNRAVINGDGTQTRDYVYVKDVVKANVLALTTYKTNEIYNIGTGVETDVNTIFKKIRDEINPNIEEFHGPPKPGEQKRSVISFHKAEKLLGWKPEYSLDEGLKETVSFFKELYRQE